MEEFGPHCFTVEEDGRLLFTADYTDMENLITWILTFGEKAEVLEPEEVRSALRHIAEATIKNYTEDKGAAHLLYRRSGGEFDGDWII